MSDNADKVTPASCTGVIFGADHSVYNATGFAAIRDQTLDPTSYMSGNQVEQTAVVFPTVEQARAVLTSQTNQWRTCASLPPKRKAAPLRWASDTAKVASGGRWPTSMSATISSASR